jgi:DNA-binding transcriptional regulator YdaS (Cro superfamily)
MKSRQSLMLAHRCWYCSAGNIHHGVENPAPYRLMSGRWVSRADGHPAIERAATEKTRAALVALIVDRAWTEMDDSMCGRRTSDVRRAHQITDERSPSGPLAARADIEALVAEWLPAWRRTWPKWSPSILLACQPTSRSSSRAALAAAYARFPV